jgi:hypothetical protein
MGPVPECEVLYGGGHPECSSSTMYPASERSEKNKNSILSHTGEKSKLKKKSKLIKEIKIATLLN